MRHCLLKTAVEGKLVNQDPTDESANMLLDRIRKTKIASVNNEKNRRIKNKNEWEQRRLM